MFTLELLFQEDDPSALGIGSASGAGLECGSGVLEELLLPTVEHRGVDAVLVTQIRDRSALEEVETQNGDLLLSRESLPDFLGHGKPPLEIVAYSSRRFVPFRLKQNTPALAAIFLLDRLEAGLAVGAFPHGQQIPAFRIQKEEQAVEQREGGLVNVREFFARGLALEVEPRTAVGQEALGQVREDGDEDPVLEPVSQPLGILAAALEDTVEPAALGPPDFW